MKSKRLFTSFLVSLVTLMLCLVSFAGTTFAWFTDTVSNTGNKIQAGTLKIDLLQNKTEDFSSEDKYVSIKDNLEPVFDSGEGTGLLWEPGQTQVAYLAVANNGNLALKYNIILDVVDRETNEDLTQAMADAFTYAVINQESPASVGNDWPTVKAAAVAPNGYNANLLAAIHAVDTTAKSARITAAPNGKLLAGEKDYFAIAIHMNETVGNAYQNGLIEFDVNVVATQLNSEEDGFESPDYDKDAIFPSIAARIEGKASTEKIEVNEGKISGDPNPEGGTTDERYIEVKSTSSTTETNVLGSANIPVSAVNNGIPDGESSTKPSVINKMQSLVQPAPTEDVNVKDEIVITLNVNTKAATTVSIDLDVNMIGEITRTVTPTGSETPTSVETKQTSIKELAAPVIVNIDLEAGLDNVSVTHTHEGEAPVSMEKVDEYGQLGDGNFFYDRMTGKLSLKTSKFSEFDIKYSREDVIENKEKGKTYPSLADAFKEAEVGETIKVLKDTDVPAEVIKNVTLDVNGKKVSNVVVINDATLTVKGGGTFYANTNENGFININDGTYQHVIFGGTGKVNVTGGIYEKFDTLENATVVVEISGGEFQEPVEKINVLCADGYKAKAIEGKDNWCSVVPYEDGDTVRIGKTVYTSLKDSINNANSNDELVLLNNISEDDIVISNSTNNNIDGLVINLNGYKLNTNQITIYDVANVTIKNGDIKSSNTTFRIGEHHKAIIKWKYADQYPLYGHHPLAPAKNIVLENLNVDSGSNTMFYYTNIHDDLDRGAPSNYVDNDLYGKYIYKTGYTTQEQSDYRKYDEVFTACSDKDSVTINGGTYSTTSPKGFVDDSIMKNYTTNVDVKAVRYEDVLNVVSGTFTNDSLRYYVDDSKYMVGTKSADIKSYSVVDNGPTDYTAKVNNIYYQYVGGANDAIALCDFADVVYLKESADVEKKFAKDDVLTVVYEVDDISYTGAVPEEKYEILTRPSDTVTNGTEFYSKFQAVAAVYATTQGGDWRKATKVGEYATLAEAVTALQSNYTVVILKDFTVGDDMTYSYGGGKYKCAMGYAARSTIDFNGHMITYTGSGSCIVSSQSTGYLYIKDTSAEKTGGITATNGSCFRMMNAKSDYTNFYDVNFTAPNGYALQLEGGTGITINSGRYISKNKVSKGWKVTTLTINGGTYAPVPDAQYYASGKSAYDNGDGTYTVR